MRRRSGGKGINSSSGSGESTDDPSLVEVRSTRAVVVGEALTISYLVVERAHRGHLAAFSLRHGFNPTPASVDSEALVLSSCAKDISEEQHMRADRLEEEVVELEVSLCPF